MPLIETLLSSVDRVVVHEADRNWSLNCNEYREDLTRKSKSKRKERGVKTCTTSEQIKGYRGADDIDSLIHFIENRKGSVNAVDNNCAVSPPSATLTSENMRAEFEHTLPQSAANKKSIIKVSLSNCNNLEPVTSQSDEVQYSTKTSVKLSSAGPVYQFKQVDCNDSLASLQSIKCEQSVDSTFRNGQITINASNKIKSNDTDLSSDLIIGKKNIDHTTDNKSIEASDADLLVKEQSDFLHKSKHSFGRESITNLRKPSNDKAWINYENTLQSMALSNPLLRRDLCSCTAKEHRQLLELLCSLG